MRDAQRSCGFTWSGGVRGSTLRAVLLLLVAACLCGRAVAIQNGNSAVEVPTEIDLQSITDRITALTALEQKGEIPAVSVQELKLLRETAAFMDQGAAARVTADRFVGEARTAPEQLAQIDTFLASPTDQLLAPVDGNQSLEDLVAQLEAARVRRQTEQELRAKVDADEQHRTARRAEIPAERGLATERLDALVAVIATGANPEEPTVIVEARRRHALAEQFARRATLKALDEELRNYDARRALLDKRRAYRDRRIAVEAQNITALQELVTARQVSVAEATQRDAARQQREAANAHPLVRAILNRNQELTARHTEILGQNGADDAAKSDAERALVEWTSAFARSESRVERVGLTNAIGQHLRNQVARLPDVERISRQMATRDKRVGKLVNEAEDLALALEGLTDLERAVERELQGFAGTLPDTDLARDELRMAARDALLQQREYCSNLSTSINKYLDTTLIELQNAQRDLHDLINEYASFMNERVLWTRSTEALRIDDFRLAAIALAWLGDKEGWDAAAAHLRTDASANLAFYLLCGLIVLTLILSQRTLRRRLEAVGTQTKRYTTDRFSLTAIALLITVLMAAAVPALMAFVGWRLTKDSTAGDLGVGVGRGLLHAAKFLFVAELIRLLCRPGTRGGVGNAHFRWKAPTLQIVRRHLRWLTPMAVPLTFLIGATSPVDSHYDSLGRFAFIALMVVFALFVQRMLLPSAALVRPFLVSHRGGWLDRLRYLWFPFVVSLPIAAAVIAGFGYFYSAAQIELRVIDTTWMLLAMFVARASLLRSLFLAQRRLDMAQRKKKRAADTEAGRAQAADAPMSTHPVIESVPEKQAKSVPESEQIDVAAVSAQTRELLNTAFVFAVLIGLAVVWLKMLPALGFFQQIELWTPETVASATESIMDVGTPTATTTSTGASEAAGAITLGHVVYSVLILLVTALVSKNIPGLLEIVLLQRLPISPSGRYALTTIVRYLLVIVGLAWAFGTIGIGWSKVQWLVAAMSVGLGFGLQEIFANFVSGLIILFERPVRVGDTVTVGGISGTVTRLRIRAMMIVDWDRKELIIPNKEFVTGQIINWTLSDPILRLVIEVGIAYGSDTKLAEELMLKAAAADPVVMKDPAPTVVFRGFGDSSLDFRLRVFIPHIDHWISVQHRMHNAVDQAFREAGIVIPFPQRDVHMYPVPRAEEDK